MDPGGGCWLPPPPDAGRANLCAGVLLRAVWEAWCANDALEAELEAEFRVCHSRRKGEGEGRSGP